MKSRKNLLKKSRLYLILNRKSKSNRSLENICSVFSAKGAGLIQLRDKKSAKKEVLKFAKKLSRLLKRTQTLFIVNDHIDIAKASCADGVHLGQCDCSVKQAREVLGKDKIIGVSCHSLKQAQIAQKQGADYIGIGPIFSTPTKPEYKPIGLEVLSKLKGKIKIPYFAIGDIHQGNLKKVTACGARRVAVARAILDSNNPVSVIAEFKDLLIRK